MYEVHLIAYYYHWSADLILSMAIKRRKEWCDFIVCQLTEESNAIKRK